VKAAVAGTRLFRPAELAGLLDLPGSGGAPPRVEVTAETTQVAARRLVQDEGIDDLALLNFASARNPGGGFVNGAKAQEEDLARCSALWHCLKDQAGYYAPNRATKSLLYTDHLLFSPRVPFFSVRSRGPLLEESYCASVITAPAPNRGQVLRRDIHADPQVTETVRRRAGMVLAAAEAMGSRNLLLGAWGCGVFCNDPATVADAFGRHLESARFGGAFDRVVFGIKDNPRLKTLDAFRARLGE